MEWYQTMAVVAAILCFVAFMLQAFYLCKLGKPKDLSKKAGNVKKGVMYSFVGAMSPTQKESAYKHLPTYAAGIIYHIGTFVMLLLFLSVVIDLVFNTSIYRFIPSIEVSLEVILIISSIAGLSILIKRIVKYDLRHLSTPDDYISNIITTSAQIATFLLLFSESKMMVLTYFIVMTLLMLWMPIGKTKHLLYFFFARFHLGYFYGWRNCWPIKTEK